MKASEKQSFLPGDLVQVNLMAWTLAGGKIGIILKESETMRGHWTILIEDTRYSFYETEFDKL